MLADGQVAFIPTEALSPGLKRLLDARKLIGLRMMDNAIPRAGYPVQAGGETVGHVTSGTLSPTLGEKIAMALVPAGLAGVGNAFEVVVRDRPYRAEQVKLPFYRRPRD